MLTCLRVSEGKSLAPENSLGPWKMRLGELGLANEISNPSEAAKMDASGEWRIRARCCTCLDMENRPRLVSRMVATGGIAAPEPRY
jgi:hypothetical protein